MGHDVRLTAHVRDGGNFAAAVAWQRLFNAEMAVQSATLAGLDHPTVHAIGLIRDEVWAVLCAQTTYDERTEVLARARRYLTNDKTRRDLIG